MSYNEYTFNLFEIIFGVIISNEWKQELNGTRKKHLSIEFYIQDLRI